MTLRMTEMILKNYLEENQQILKEKFAPKEKPLQRIKLNNPLLILPKMNMLNIKQSIINS